MQTTKSSLNRAYIIGIAFVSAIAGLLFGFDLVVISGALQFIANAFSISEQQTFLREIIVSAVPAGALIGAICSHKSSFHFGRRKSIIITAIMFFFGTLLVVLAPNAESVIFGRLIMGFAVGLSATIVPMYLAEISPPDIRGTVVFLYQFAITVGIAMGFVVNYLFQASGGWRYMFAVGLIPSALLGLGMLPLPASPRWLLTKGRLYFAKSALRKLRGTEKIETEIENIRQTIAHSHGGLKLLFSKKIRKLVVISFGLFVFQQFTGINTIFYYAPNIFRAAGFSGSAAPTLASVSTGGMFVFATIFGVLLVDVIGRRKLLIIGLLGIALCQMLQGADLHHLLFYQAKTLSIFAALAAIAFYAISITGIAYLIMSEVFPLNVRTVGMAVASCANWGVNMLVAATFLTLANTIGMGNTFWLYAGLTFIGFLFVWFFVPETKGRSLEEIETNLYAGVPMRHLGSDPAAIGTKYFPAKTKLAPADFKTDWDLKENWHVLENLKNEIYEANLALVEAKLVTLTWGNVSCIDRKYGIVVIKPSGVAYQTMRPSDMVVVDPDGNIIDGALIPSSDLKTHLEIYRAWPAVNSVVHTHSTHATMFAQACRTIPCLGTTHADHFYGDIPITRPLTQEEVNEDYEKNTGKAIIGLFAEAKLDPLAMPGILVVNHAPFTWGKNPKAAVKNAIILEEAAKMALGTIQLNPQITEIPKHILDKHYYRKHGANAYYGQKKTEE